MAGKNVKVKIDLDFTADYMSLDKIREKMDLAFEAIKINLDPSDVKKVESQLKEFQKIAENSFDTSKGIMNFKKMDTAITNSEVIGQMDLFHSKLGEAGIDGSKSFNAIKSSSDLLQKSLVENNGILSKMGTTLMNTIRWNISASAINAVTGEFQKMYHFAKDLDRSLTNIRVVSGLSADNMARFAVNANRAAKELKVSTLDYTDAALIFYQQGLKAIEVQNMTKAAIIGGNITGQSTEEMSNLLTSVMNGYKIATQDVLMVTDKLAAVGASTASDFYELATAMSKVASMAQAAGVPIDQLNAQIATIVSVTKESPESIGTSLKTIYGRMLAFKVDTKALMKDEDGEVFGAPKVEEALQAYNKVTGAQISLFKTTADGRRELRELGDVITEIGDSWGNTTDNATKFGLATALAGSRQQNRLVALFESWDMYQDAVITSLEAEGTSLRQNEVYMDSYQGKLKGLQAAKEELYMAFTDSDSLKTLIDGLTKGVELFGKLADLAGNFSGVLAVAGALLAKPIYQQLSRASAAVSSFGGTGSGTSQKELAVKKELAAISKAYGADEANRIRNNLRNAKEELAFYKFKKEALAEEATTVALVVEAMEGPEKKRAKELKDIIRNRGAMDTSRLSIEQMKIAYEDLYSATEKVDGLKLKAATEENKAEVELILAKANKELADAQKKVDALKASVENLRQESQQYGAQVPTSEGKVAVETGNFKDAAENAKKVNMSTQDIRMAMITIVPLLGVAKDSSKGWGDMMKTFGASISIFIPQILTGIKAVNLSLVGTKVGAMGVAKAFAAAMGPVGWLIAGAAALAVAIKLATKHANQFKDAFSEMEATAEALEQQQDIYDGIKSRMSEIVEKQEELVALADGTITDEKQKELDMLGEQLALLEQQRILQEFTLQLAKDEAEAAALKTANAKLQSEYIHMSAADGRDGPFKMVTAAEELEAANKAYAEHAATIEEMTAKFEEMRKSADVSKTAQEDYAKKIEQVTEKLNDDKNAIAKHSAALIENNKHLSTRTEEGRKAKEINEAVLETSTKLMENSLALTITTGDNTDAIDLNTIGYDANNDAKAINEEAMEKLNEQYLDASSNIQTFTGFLAEMNSKEGLSAKSKQDLITKYEQFLPYLHDEALLHKKIEEAVAQEEQAQYDAYISKISMSEEYYTQLTEDYGDLITDFATMHGIDLSNAVTLAEAKEEVEVQLINRLAALWAGYYEATETGLKRTQGYSRQLEAAGRKAGMGEDAWSKEEWAVIQGQLAQFKAIDEAAREGAAAAEKAKADWAALMDETAFKGVPESLKNLNKGLSDVAKSSSKAGKETKEAVLAIADAYEELNFLLDRNNVLLDINKQRQSDSKRDSKRTLELLDEEIKLRKARQILLHEYNEGLRIEAKGLQATLSSTFNFTGSWDDNSMMITNMDAINGKSKEMEKDFKRIIEIMKELPKASAEWAKLNAELKAIDVSKLLIQFEAIDKRMSVFNHEMEDLEYNFKLAGVETDDYAAKMEHAASKITIFANEIAQAKYELELLQNDGIVRTGDELVEFEKKIDSLNKTIKDGTLNIAEQDRAWDSLVASQKKAAEDKYLKEINGALQKQRDELTAIEQIQESIVAIIRKRGEEERRILDENHTKEMELLEERHNEKKKKNQEELDWFKKMIQDKINALDEQYAEEDYIEALDKERNEVNRIQREIDVLSLDDSLTARNKVIELRKQLSDQNEKIAKMQQKKERDLVKKSLEDQLKDREVANKEEEDLADKSFSAEKERLESIYKENQKYLELAYSDAKVYEEAKQSIIRGTVEVTKDGFVDIYTAFKNFEDEFGKGMGIMGNVIKNDFLKQLDLAQQALERLARTGGELSRPRDDYTRDEIQDHDYGWTEPERPSREPTRDPVDNSRPEEFLKWTSSDYSAYIANKKKWDEANRKNDLAAKNQAAVANMILRQEYWGKDRINEDKYSYQQLENYRGYKDGGVMSETGLFKGHGSEQSSEVVFSAKTAKKLWEYIENMPKLATSFEMPRMPSMAGVNNFGSERYEINFNIDGNMDRSILPEVKKMIIDGIEKAQEEKISKFKDIGIKRSIR